MGLNPQGQPTRQTSEESVPDTEIRGVSWTEGVQCGTGFEAEKSLVWLEGKEWEGSGGGQVRESGRRQLKHLGPHVELGVLLREEKPLVRLS